MIQLANKASDVLTKEQLKQCNVFLTDNALHFFNSDGSEVVYAYSDKYIMPVKIIKKMIFRYCLFLDNPFCRDASVSGSMKDFLEEVTMALKMKGVQWILETPAYSFFKDYPTGAKHIPFGSHVVDLSLDVDTLFSKVHSKHRNVIKKAQKDGVVIEKGNDDWFIEEYARIDVDTWKRSNRSSAGKDDRKNQLKTLGENAIIYLGDYYEKNQKINRSNKHSDRIVCFADLCYAFFFRFCGRRSISQIRSALQTVC